MEKEPDKKIIILREENQSLAQRINEIDPAIEIVSPGEINPIWENYKISQEEFQEPIYITPRPIETLDLFSYKPNPKKCKRNHEYVDGKCRNCPKTI